jgi:hypothetical protein
LPPETSARCVADLLDGAARHQSERERRAAVERAEQHARLEAQRARLREQRLDELAGDQDGAWQRIEAMVATKKPGQYDAAVALLTDLRAIAEREGRTDAFARQARALRERHTSKPAFIRRLATVGIGAGRG